MMDENQDNGIQDGEELSFAEMFESYDSNIKTGLKQGEMVEGKIISIGSNQVYVDTGTKSDGVISKSELLDEDGQCVVNVGDLIKLYVVSISESEIILSKALSGAGKSIMLKEAAMMKTPVEGKITDVIKGGFSVDILGKRAFCPVSQIDVKYVENQEDYVGKTFHFLINRYEEAGRNIVVSRRDLLNEENKEKQKQFFEKVGQGDTVFGTVSKLMPFGAFVELALGVEGMVHISELSWSRVEKPDDVVQVGESVTVKILKIEPGKDAQTNKISLSMRQTSSDPWDTVDTRYNVGDQLSGKVVRLAAFGAFVEIAPGVDGLVHISEMSHAKRVLRPEDEVAQGEIVQVIVKAIDMDSKRISLSIKDANGDPWTGASTKYTPGLVLEGHLEKKEKFGLFINLEPGITGLMPSSNINNSENASVFEKLRPSDPVQIMIQAVDEERRRITLASPEQKNQDNWKQFADTQKSSSFGSMGNLLQEALKNKK